MKKILLAFFTVSLCFSWCNAQDTIMLAGGDVILAHVNKVNKQVWFTYFISDTALMADSSFQGVNQSGSININEVAYIHYKEGKLQKFSNKQKKEAKLPVDSNKMRLPQDTLLLWSGEKITANIIKMGPRIYLQNYHDLADNKYNLRRAEVHSIYYSDGHSVSWKARDSVTRKFFLSVDGGMCLPAANSHSFYSYGKNAALPSNFSTINQNDGAGPHIDINGGYKFYRAFNVILMIGEDINPSLNNNLQAGENHNYYVTQYLAGFGMSTNEATHDVSIRIEWLAGLATANFPSFSTSTASYSDNFMYAGSSTNVKLSNGKGLENYANATIEYKPGPVFGIHLSAGFVFANIKYSNSSTYTETSSNYNYQTQSGFGSITTMQTNTNTISMPIAAFQLSLGLTYRFGTK